MRIYRMRADIWLSLAAACLVAWGAGKITSAVTENTYEAYTEKHTVADGEIGGAAEEDVFRAQSIEDLLSHDTFTVVSPGIEYRNRGAGYYGSYYLYSLTLPSGERVAAAINMDSVQTTGQDLYSGDSIMPVGKIIYEDLAKEPAFLDQIQYKEPLTRTDFYVDMMGNGGTASKEAYGKRYVDIVQAAACLICFPLFHALGAKLGLFPYFFPPKKKRQESEWE